MSVDVSPAPQPTDTTPRPAFGILGALGAVLLASTAIGLLIGAEHKLMQHERRIDAPMPMVVDPGLVGPTPDPDTPTIMGGNGGNVPPWLQ